MRYPIYRVKPFVSRWSGKVTIWNAYPMPGYNQIMFPGIAGARTLAECLDRVYEQIERSKATAAKQWAKGVR